MSRLGLGMGLGLATISSTFIPTSIANCKLWLRADLGITLNGSNVSAWADQSGTGDSNKNVAQATGTKQPAYVTSDSGYSNKPLLTYDATDDALVSGTWSSAISQPHTVFVVGQGEGGTTDYFFDSLAIGTQCAILGLINTVRCTANGSDFPSSGVSVTSPRVICTEFDNTNTKIYVSAKTAQVTGAAGTNGFTGTTIGARADGAESLGGKLAEVIVYSGLLSTTDRNKVLDYLGVRYNISIGA